MIEATVAMVVMAGLFVAFGMMAVPDRRGTEASDQGQGCASGTGGGCGMCVGGGEQCEFHGTGASR